MEKDEKSLSGGLDWKAQVADRELEDWVYDGMVLMVDRLYEEQFGLKL